MQAHDGRGPPKVRGLISAQHAISPVLTYSMKA